KGLPEIDRKLIKKLTQELIEENVLDYWSSGSTTYITLKGYQPGSGENPEEGE
ncbi:dissimilatory sulfite reductase-asociated protein DsvD, partial [Candidatus Poribacteria bacterium]|nr:dissimilatory sulfite reductase-asociated protein DsvD [Candidatus Poribacteria bacterium]